MRIEHWTTAAEHGQLAGRNALLEPEQRAPHHTPPYFWSDQYDLKIQAVGLPALASRSELVELETDEPGRPQRFVAACVDTEQRVVGVVAVNAAKRLSWYRKQFADGVPPALTTVQAELAAEDSGSLGIPALGASL